MITICLQLIADCSLKGVVSALMVLQRRRRSDILYEGQSRQQRSPQCLMHGCLQLAMAIVITIRRALQVSHTAYAMRLIDSIQCVREEHTGDYIRNDTQNENILPGLSQKTET